MVLNLTVYLLDIYYELKLESFDLNHDGSFSKEEMTPEAEKAMHDVVSDTARNLAPFTLIPISFFLGLITYFIIRLVKTIKRERRKKF